MGPACSPTAFGAAATLAVHEVPRSGRTIRRGQGYSVRLTAPPESISVLDPALRMA